MSHTRRGRSPSSLDGVGANALSPSLLALPGWTTETCSSPVTSTASSGASPRRCGEHRGDLRSTLAAPTGIVVDSNALSSSATVTPIASSRSSMASLALQEAAATAATRTAWGLRLASTLSVASPSTAATRSMPQTQSTAIQTITSAGEVSTLVGNGNLPGTSDMTSLSLARPIIHGESPSTTTRHIFVVGQDNCVRSARDITSRRALPELW